MSKKEEKRGEENKPKLTKKQTKEITDFITELKKTEKDRTAIRKAVFEKFQIDITMYELKWDDDTLTGHVPVDTNKQLAPLEDLKKHKENIDYEHYFDDAELIEHSKRRSTLSNEKRQLESRKKAAVKDYDSQIQSRETQIEELDTQIDNGFEMRHATAECVKYFKEGVKRYYVNNKVVKTDKLTDSDKQLNIAEGGE